MKAKRERDVPNPLNFNYIEVDFGGEFGLPVVG